MSFVRPFATYMGCLMQSLAAVVDEHSISPLPSLYPSIPRSSHHYRCHQIAMMQGKLWSGPNIPHPLPEREQDGWVREDAQRKSTYREEKDCEC